MSHEIAYSRIAFFDVGLDETFAVIHQLQKRFPVSVLCHAFDVHRSSYRYWLAHKDDVDPDREALEVSVNDAFELSNGSKAQERSLK